MTIRRQQEDTRIDDMGARIRRNADLGWEDVVHDRPMTATLRPWMLVLGFIALYWAGGVLGNTLVVGEDSVVLLWAPGVLAFVFLLHQGRRWWPVVAVADVVFSLTGTAVPPVFIVFTVVANTAGALAAVTVARHLGLRPGMGLNLTRLWQIALAGATLGVASAAPGVAGLVAAGFTTLDHTPGAFAKWAVANLFSVMVLGPSLSLLWPGGEAARENDAPSHRLRIEHLAWSIALAIALGLVATTDAHRTLNAPAILALPTLVMLWGALRVSPRFVALGTLVSGIGLAMIATTTGGALERPVTVLDALLLLALLITLTLAPLILMAAMGEARRIGREALEHARTDELTGLANRQGLAHRVPETLAHRPDGSPLLLALVDIDNFKLVNDAGGTAAGDAFLRGIAGLLRALLPTGSLIGRLAGDQFVVLLDDRAPDDIAVKLEHVLAAVRDYRQASGNNLVSASASIGAIRFRCGQADYAELLRLADAACATAKDQGGNRLRLTAFDAAAAAVAQHTAALRWAVRLDTALHEGHFRLYCQSIAGLQGIDHGGRHLEILLRMVDPDTGEVMPPGPVVAAAEKFHMGPRLDRHVMDLALGWFERNPQALAQVDTCAINLCAASVNDPGFPDFLRERFACSSVPPGKVCLEITETSAVRDLDDAQQFIAAARGLGLRLALDDFGAGFCSFAYLRRLDVDFFKIDGGFIRDLESSALSLAIVRSIAEIARSIDKRTIAEFVEDDAIRERLAQLGVDFGQGYAIDRPQPIEQFFLRPAALRRHAFRLAAQ